MYATCTRLFATCNCVVHAHICLPHVKGKQNVLRNIFGQRFGTIKQSVCFTFKALFHEATFPAPSKATDDDSVARKFAENMLHVSTYFATFHKQRISQRCKN